MRVVTAIHAAQSRTPDECVAASTRRCCALMIVALTSVRRTANTDPRLNPAYMIVGSSENVNGEFHEPVNMTTSVTRANSASMGGAV
jgi:hypothetical protein